MSKPMLTLNAKGARPMTVYTDPRVPSISRRKVLTSAGLLTVALAAGPGAILQSSPVLAQEIAAQFARSGTETFDHSAWTDLLKTYVKPSPDGVNRVDYDGLKRSGRPALAAYLKTLESTDVNRLARNEQFAYWANLYNAKTVDIILQYYPVKTIRDIDISPGLFSNGPWGKKVATVNGVALSLDDIEHVIMRPSYNDPRIHYAVSCAAVGCPNLGTAAFTGPALEDQLNKAARDYVNDRRGFTISGNRITASKLYKWYQDDFGGSEAEVLRHALQYAAPDLAAKLKSIADIRSFAYDWSLNGTKSLLN